MKEIHHSLYYFYGGSEQLEINLVDKLPHSSVDVLWLLQDLISPLAIFKSKVVVVYLIILPGSLYTPKSSSCAKERKGVKLDVDLSA